MVDIKTLFLYILLFGALAVPGYILGKRGKMKQDSIRDISVILTDIAMPFLVLSKLIESDIKDFTLTEIVACIIIPIIICFTLFFISKAVFKKEEQKKRAASIFCAIFPNCGFLGIPLAAAMFPNTPKVCALVALYNVMSTFMLLTLGEYVYSGDIQRVKPLKILIKPITIAVALGFLFSFFELSEKLPSVGLYSDILASLTTPLSMIVLGAELSRLKWRELFLNKSMYLSSAIRLLISPLASLLMLSVLKYLFSVNIGFELATAIMISSGVSTAATASAIAERCSADGKHAAILSLGATILAALTLPCILLLYNLLF